MSKEIVQEGNRRVRDSIKKNIKVTEGGKSSKMVQEGSELGE